MIPKRRLKALARELDFNLIVQELVEHCTPDDIHYVTGIDKKTISLLKTDARKQAEGWQGCIKLCDMYLRVTNKTTLPFI